PDPLRLSPARGGWPGPGASRAPAVPQWARPAPDGPATRRQRPQRMRAAAAEGFDRLKERAPAGAGAISALGVTQAMAAIMASAISEVPTAVGSLGSALRS